MIFNIYIYISVNVTIFSRNYMNLFLVNVSILFLLETRNDLISGLPFRDVSQTSSPENLLKILTKNTFPLINAGHQINITPLTRRSE